MIQNKLSIDKEYLSRPTKNSDDVVDLSLAKKVMDKFAFKNEPYDSPRMSALVTIAPWFVYEQKLKIDEQPEMFLMMTDHWINNTILTFGRHLFYDKRALVDPLEELVWMMKIVRDISEDKLLEHRKRVESVYELILIDTILVRYSSIETVLKNNPVFKALFFVDSPSVQPTVFDDIPQDKLKQEVEYFYDRFGGEAWAKNVLTEEVPSPPEFMTKKYQTFLDSCSKLLSSFRQATFYNPLNPLGLKKRKRRNTKGSRPMIESYRLEQRNLDKEIIEKRRQIEKWENALLRMVNNHSYDFNIDQETISRILDNKINEIDYRNKDEMLLSLINLLNVIRSLVPSKKDPSRQHDRLYGFGVDVFSTVDINLNKKLLNFVNSIKEDLTNQQLLPDIDNNNRSLKEVLTDLKNSLKLTTKPDVQTYEGFLNWMMKELLEKYQKFQSAEQKINKSTRILFQPIGDISKMELSDQAVEILDKFMHALQGYVTEYYLLVQNFNKTESPQRMAAIEEIFRLTFGKSEGEEIMSLLEKDEYQQALSTVKVTMDEYRASMEEKISRLKDRNNNKYNELLDSFEDLKKQHELFKSGYDTLIKRETELMKLLELESSDSIIDRVKELVGLNKEYQQLKTAVSADADIDIIIAGDDVTPKDIIQTLKKYSEELLSLTERNSEISQRLKMAVDHNTKLMNDRIKLSEEVEFYRDYVNTLKNKIISAYQRYQSDVNKEELEDDLKNLKQKHLEYNQKGEFEKLDEVYNKINTLMHNLPSNLAEISRLKDELSQAQAVQAELLKKLSDTSVDSDDLVLGLSQEPTAIRPRDSVPSLDREGLLNVPDQTAPRISLPTTIAVDPEDDFDFGLKEITDEMVVGETGIDGLSTRYYNNGTDYRTTDFDLPEATTTATMPRRSAAFSDEITIREYDPNVVSISAVPNTIVSKIITGQVLSNDRCLEDMEKLITCQLWPSLQEIYDMFNKVPQHNRMVLMPNRGLINRDEFIKMIHVRQQISTTISNHEDFRIRRHIGGKLIKSPVMLITMAIILIIMVAIILCIKNDYLINYNIATQIDNYYGLRQLSKYI